MTTTGEVVRIAAIVDAPPPTPAMAALQAAVQALATEDDVVNIHVEADAGATLAVWRLPDDPAKQLHAAIPLTAADLELDPEAFAQVIWEAVSQAFAAFIESRRA